VWYNFGMNIEFGTGPTLQEFSPWLRDPAARLELILDAAERDSVIEGLPPLHRRTTRPPSQTVVDYDRASISARRITCSIK
jgi:hypothetical protein